MTKNINMTIEQIRQAIVAGASLEEALKMVQEVGIRAHIEGDLLVLDGVIMTTPEGGDPGVSDAPSIEEALEECWQEEASYRGPEDLPCVVAVKASYCAFTAWGALYDYAPQWKIELLQEPEPPCSGPEHEWASPYEVVGGVPENPGVWANSAGGVTITEVCLRCGLTRFTDTLWQDPATGTVWENVVTYDSHSNREAALKWAASKVE